MNNPKEKAEELTRDMHSVNVTNPSEYGMEWNMAKQCALIAVDEIIESVNDEHVSDIFIDFWEQVKNEIEKL
jgi:hypothetical protein